MNQTLLKSWLLMLLMLVGVSAINAQEKTVKFQAQVKSGTIDVTARIFNDYTAELTLPQDGQYIGHDVTVSMGFYGATGLGIGSGESRSFTKSIDLTPYVKSYISEVLTSTMIDDLIAQVKDNLTAEQVARLLDEYETNMGESEVNKIIDNATVTAEMVGRIIPAASALTKENLQDLVSGVTLTEEQQNVVNNWDSQSDEDKAEARAQIISAINSQLADSNVQANLKAKAKAMDAALRKSMIVDYLESLSADEKKTHVIDYINGLGASERKEMVLDYINSMSNDNLAALIDQVAASMHLNAQTLLEKACEFAGFGTAWIPEALNPIYGFSQTAANVKVVDGKKSEGFKYTVSGVKEGGKNTKLVAAPDDLAKAQAAWSMVADHMQGSTQTIEDNKLKVVKGTYVQFGDQRLKFIKDFNLFEGGMNWTLSKENLVNNATQIYADFLDAVEIENTNMETTDAANTYILAAYMPKGSDIHMGSSVLTLTDNCRVELDAKDAAAAAGDAAKEALSQEITEMRMLILNSVGKRAKVKALAKYGVNMFTRALAIADGREVDLRIIFAPDCDVDRDGRVTADDVPALLDNLLGKDAGNKNDHETNIDGGESDVQSLGDLTKLINVLRTLGAFPEKESTTPATTETTEP